MDFRRGALAVAALALLPACNDTGPSGPDQTPGAADPKEQNQASGAGDYALDFLTEDVFGALVVEVDWIEDRSPSPAALDELAAILGDLCRKSGGIQVLVDDAIPSPVRSSWSVAEVSALESIHRDASSMSVVRPITLK